MMPGKVAAVCFAALLVGGLVFGALQLKAASICVGPTFDAGTKTLSLVCTESSDIHELACSDATNPDTLSLTVNGLNETLTCPADPVLANGSCGAVNNACLAGTLADTADDASNYLWSCNGVNGGTNAPCSLPLTTPPPPPPSTTKPNFTDLIIDYTPSTGFNPTTGEYDSVTVNFQTINRGLSDAPNGANYEFQFDRGANGYDLTTHGAMGPLAVGDNFSQTEVVPGPIVFGDSSVRVYVDYQDVVDETDDTPADNERTLPLLLPPPNPNIDISADRLLVRSGENVTLTWNTKVTYPMACQVFGPGITTTTFDPSINGATGTKVSEKINAKSVFTLSCVVAGTTFTDTVTIETQGVIEET